jgi:hypothetical protein
MILTETFEKKTEERHHPEVRTHSRWFHTTEAVYHEINRTSLERHPFVVPWQMDNDTKENSQLKIKF